MNNNRHTISVSRYNGSSNIPLRRQLSRQSSTPNGTPSKVPNDAAHRWRQKYDESEEKRKTLLSEKEKALRGLNDLEKKHLNLQEKNEQLEIELFEKNEEYSKLSTASKNLWTEYERLKNQYETETGAMASVLKDASKWYKENKELKRKTLYLGDKDAVDEGVDAGESSNDADIENLNRTIKQLSTEVAELQTELDTVRQSEFQTLEQNMKLNEELELRKAENRKFKAELEELRTEHQQLRRVSEMMKKELEDLKEIEENQRNDIILLKKEAGEQKRERNILKHQSTLIMQGLNDSNGTESLILLQEIENLKRTLEDERSRHEEELNSLQDRFEQDQENDSHIEILEERLKLVEEELKSAISRAEAAEAKLKAPPLPPPPPPPPPPPFAASDCPPVVPLRRRRSRATVEDLAKTIGVQESSPDKKPAPPGVNHDIINAIKEGKFTLKKSKKEGKMEKDRDTPKAVSEILNILGSLRRAPKKRQSQYLGDVQL